MPQVEPVRVQPTRVFIKEIKPTRVQLLGIKIECPDLGELVIENPFVSLDVDLDIRIENCWCGKPHYLEN